MAHFYFTATGKVYRRNAATTAVTELTIPATLTLESPAVKPVLQKYRNRIFNVGQYDRLCVFDELAAFRPGGVTAPATTPVLADGAAVGSTGNMIAYQTFCVKSGSTLIAESNPGPASNTLASAGTGRVTTNLDAAPADAHVTHTRLYISVDGAIPALADEQVIAGFAGTVTENVLTAALGETLPVRSELNGTITLDINSRGVPPYTYWCELYHDAMWYAGDPSHPERIYPSKLFEPEGVNTTPVTVNGRTEYPWLTTTDGQPVTGIKRVGDELIIGKPRGIDIIQGYSYGDYQIRSSSNYWGVISHFSMKVCGPNGSLWFAAPQGPTIYSSGSYRFVGGPIETWWRDAYRDDPDLFEQCYAAADRFWRNYRLQIPWNDGGTVYLNGEYFAAELDQPQWVMDYRTRRDTCQVELQVTDAEHYFDLYTGSSDGYTRLENVLTDADDDGDTFAKKMTIQSPHRFMGDQGGDDAHGFTFNGLDLFLKHTDQAATVSLYAGDDHAIEAAAPQWSVVSKATAAASGEYPLVPKTSEHHTPTNVSGKGLTLKVEVSAPVDVEFRGWGVDFTQGPQSRARK